MAKDFFGRLEETIQTTGKAAAQKAKEVADSAKRHNDLRVAKRDLNDLYRQVGEKYFEEHMDYPQAEYIDLFNLIEKHMAGIARNYGIFRSCALKYSQIVFEL